MVFNPDPSQLSFESLKKYSLFRNYDKTFQKLCNIQKKITNFCLFMRYVDHKKTLDKYVHVFIVNDNLQTFSPSTEWYAERDAEPRKCR